MSTMSAFFVRPVLCQLPAERQRNPKRHRSCPGADCVRCAGVCKSGPVLCGQLSRRGNRRDGKALQKLGFAAVEETAIGATLVKREYERLVKEGEQEVIISSCCHSVNLLIQKYYPEALPYLAKVESPMLATAA